METQNLWPDFAVEPIRSPKSILKEQAGFLMGKTNNVLSAEVETRKTRDGTIIQDFFVVAPALDNYRYEVFYVTHGALFYPLKVWWSQFIFDADSETDYMKILSEIFNAPETTRVISSLLSQSMAE